jgi:hypothetical protein
MTAKIKTPKPSRSQYEITSPSGKAAHLTRVTTILNWVIEGDGFGAMPYYGAGLFANFLFPDLDDEERDGVIAVWKESEWEPNRVLRATSKRGEQAHKLYEHLCRGVATVDLDPAVGMWYVRYDAEAWSEYEDAPVEGVPLDFYATEYDAGVCEAYHEVFQHLDPHEIISESRVHWTEHEIDDCPDEICTHGYAGTLDSLLPDDRIMIDCKTNKGEARWKAYPQMSFYGKAAEQMGLISGPIEKQIVFIPRPTPNEKGKMYDLYDDKFVDTGIVQPILDLYRYRRAWGPRA